MRKPVSTPGLLICMHAHAHMCTYLHTHKPVYMHRAHTHKNTFKKTSHTLQVKNLELSICQLVGALTGFSCIQILFFLASLTSC